MTRAAKDLFDFLVADLDSTEDTDFATQLLGDAKAKIAAGKGSLNSLNSGSQNGKSYSGITVCTNLDVATAATMALRYYASGTEPTGITFLDFGRTFGPRIS